MSRATDTAQAVVGILFVVALLGLCYAADAARRARRRAGRAWKRARHRAALALIDLGIWLDTDDELRAVEHLLTVDGHLTALLKGPGRGGGRWKGAARYHKN